MKLTRRIVLLSGLGATGALVLGWAGLPPRSRLGAASLWPADGGEVALNGWIKVSPRESADRRLDRPRSFGMPIILWIDGLRMSASTSSTW